MRTTQPCIQESAVPVRENYLDALRGWAVISVILVHCVLAFEKRYEGRNALMSGRYGVQLFFMVSAFTIFMTVERAHQHGRAGWIAFFIRRFFRILPMFWISLALYTVVPGRAPEDAAHSFAPLDFVLTAFLQHGWNPALFNALVPGGWSIAIEGMFYLLVPILSYGVRSWQAALWLLLGSLVASELAFRTVTTLYNNQALWPSVPFHLMQTFVFTWFPSQLSVFAGGIFVYRLNGHLEKQPLGKPTGALFLAISMVLILAAIDIGQHGLIPQHEYFSLGFIPLMLGLKVYPVRLVVNPITSLLGRISYSAYLLHFVILYLAKSLLFRLSLASLHGGLAAVLSLFVATLLLTLPTAWLALWYIEKPFIKLGAKLIQVLGSPRKTLPILGHTGLT